MKKIIFFAIAFVVTFNSFAQNAEQEVKEKPYEYVIVDGEKIYNSDFVDTKAEFKGGEKEMNKWLMENINYPFLALEEGKQGKVVVKFIIRKSGEISNVELVNKVFYSLDKEAMRLILIMPNWIPAKKGKKPVSSFFTLPVSFILK